MQPGERRAQILEHAARLFGDRGYHETSISDIVASADVARGTFYLYFANKRRLFEELVDILFLRIRSCIQTVTTDPGDRSPRDQLVDNLVRVFALLCEEKHMLSILFRGAVGLDREADDKLRAFYAEVLGAIENSLTLGRTIGIVRPCDTHIAATVALGAIKEVLQTLLTSPPSRDPEQDIREYANAILDIFTRGVVMDRVSIP